MPVENTKCVTDCCVYAAQVTRATPENVVLPSVTDEQQLQQHEAWLAQEVQLWLDDEWTPLDVHRELGKATGKVRKSCIKHSTKLLVT